MIDICKKLVDICNSTKDAVWALYDKKELKKGGQFSQYLITIHEIENTNHEQRSKPQIGIGCVQGLFV